MSGLAAMRNLIHAFCVMAAVVAAKPLLYAQGVDVSAVVTVQRRAGLPQAKHEKSPSPSDVVLWLTPVGAAIPAISDNPRHKGPFRLVQRDKQFTPHLLVVPAGSSVEFPNRDPFFHNVFSLFNGKRFDLGLYESGTTRTVRFDREGVSYIFCNIHPDMGAVVLALGTPYYDVSTAEGAITVHGVPPGSYRLHVWSEVAQTSDAAASERVVRVGSEAVNLGQIALEATPDPMMKHKNKFGEEYLPEHRPTY